MRRLSSYQDSVLLVTDFAEANLPAYQAWEPHEHPSRTTSGRSHPVRFWNDLGGCVTGVIPALIEWQDGSTGALRNKGRGAGDVESPAMRTARKVMPRKSLAPGAHRAEMRTGLTLGKASTQRSWMKCKWERSAPQLILPVVYRLNGRRLLSVEVLLVLSRIWPLHIATVNATTRRLPALRRSTFRRCHVFPADLSRSWRVH